MCVRCRHSIHDLYLNQSTKQVTVTYPTNTPTVTSKNYRVDLINKTGQDINALYYGQSGTYSYSQECADLHAQEERHASFYISVPDKRDHPPCMTSTPRAWAPASTTASTVGRQRLCDRAAQGRQQV